MRKSTFNPKAFEAYLLEQVRRMRHGLTRLGSRRSAKHVHGVRVASRRIKAALELVEPRVGTRAFEDLAAAAKKLRRTLGEVREADVMADALEAMATSRDEITPLIDALAHRRSKRLAKLDKAKVQRLRNALQIRKRGREALNTSRPGLETTLRTNLLRDVERFRKTSNATQAPIDFHALRILAKHIRYMCEIASATGITLAATLAKRFERVQGQLGIWHDEVVLARFITMQAAKRSLFDDEPIRARRLINLSEKRLAAADRALATFRARWTSIDRTLLQLAHRIADPDVTQSAVGRDRRVKP